MSEMKMGIDRMLETRLLFVYGSFTSIYLPGILLLLKFNKSLYNVGSYIFLPILLILILAEVVKLFFSVLQKERSALRKIDTRTTPRSRKPWSGGLKKCIQFYTAIHLLFVIYYTIIVLTGTPVTRHNDNATMLSSALVISTFVPVCLHLCVDTSVVISTKSQTQNTGLLGPAFGLKMKATLLGAWLGSIALPLEWEGLWQAWPIPCVIGALLGYTIGHFVTVTKILPALRLRKQLQK